MRRAHWSKWTRSWTKYFPVLINIILLVLMNETDEKCIRRRLHCDKSWRQFEDKKPRLGAIFRRIKNPSINMFLFERCNYGSLQIHITVIK